MGIVSLLPKAAFTLIAISLVCATGCVGPLACGPGGNCGPLAFSSCDGCGECEGCGELYVDPWINHPADQCDPCDCCGNYNGQSCGKCRTVFAGVASLWGYRCGDDGCDDGCDCGVSSCGGCGIAESGCCGDACDGCDSCCGAGEVLHVTGHPTPAPEVVEATPTAVPYRPSRVRKIFRARPNIAEGPPRASDY